MLTETTISQALASTAITAMAKAATEQGKAAVFCVVDHRGELVALLRQDHASRVSIQVAQNKAFTAARLLAPSRVVGASADYDLANLADPRMTFFGGGMPILFEGACVGAIGVSGLTNEEDEELAVIGLVAIDAALAAA